MAYPANIAFTFATQTGPIPLSELDTNFANLQAGLNGIGNGTSALQNVTITGGTISNVTLQSLSNVTITGATINGGSVASFGQIVSGQSNVTTLFASNVSVQNPILPPSVSLQTITVSLGSDVSLTNTSTYFDGPSVAQGNTGTWFVTGTVTLIDGATAIYNAKLWDGTTVIASASATTPAASQPTAISLSGILSTPAGNIRISCNDQTQTTGAIKFNKSGNSKDSTITAIRIA